MKRPRVRDVAGFLYLWLMVGFFSGTLLLVGPVQWIVRALRVRGFADSVENMIMIGVILAFIATSFAATILLIRWLARRQHPVLRLGVPAMVTMAAFASLWAWMNPTVLAGAAGGLGADGAAEAVRTESGAEFHFGPYPDHEKLAALKEAGFAGVISLQHPAVLPFEPPGIEAEKRSTSELGLPFIHAPMMPWVSDNRASLDRIREIAATGTGRYYVHCGLGRDRTNVVKRMIERMGAARIAPSEEVLEARSFAVREKPLERGMHTEIDPDVWLVPYPNEHEIYGNMLAGQVSQVVSLLDPHDPEQREWNRHMVTLFAEYEVPLLLLPLDPQDAASAERIAERVRTLPRPVVVIAPFTAPRERTEVADAFTRAWRSVSGPAPVQ